jgi:IPTL-CTERM motif
VLRYNGTTGAFLNAFVAAGSGGLSAPIGLVFGPDGNLYVASRGTNQVLRYNGTTGAFLNAFVAGGSGGLGFPGFLVFRSSAPIPTLSEWGMILLALSLLTLGTWQVTGRPALLGVAPTATGAMLLIPSRQLLRSVFVGQMVAGMGLVLYGRGIEPVAAHDVLGAVLAGMLLGAMIECYRRGQGR